MEDLGTWKLPWWTRLTWIAFLLNARNAIAVTSICSQGQTGRCFQVDSTRRSWGQADMECMSRGGSLAKVGSAIDQANLANFSLSNNILTVWTGGKVSDSDWIWTGLRDRHIQYMGCYGEDANYPDLEYIINDGRTFRYPSECSKACSNINGRYYKFSGVQFDNVNDRVICRCGSSYGKHGKRKDHKCDKQCLPPPPKNTFDERDREALDRFCGNIGFQIVVRNSGLPFHNWVGPGAQGTHDCAALDNQHRWKDYHCNDARLRYICEYDRDQSSCQSSSKQWLSTGSGGRGICISKHTNDKNWYNAKLDCKRKGGDLLEIRDHTAREKINNELSGSNNKYWIGLTKRTWTWRDGSIIDNYYSWQNSKPRPTGNTIPMCLLMGSPTLKWIDAECNQPHPFVCEYMNGPPSVVSPPPNQISSSTEPSLPGPSPGSDDPSPSPDNSNRKEAQIDPAIIGGAAGGGALVLIIIVVVVACCCCRNKPPPKKTKSKGHHNKLSREHGHERDYHKHPPKVSSRPLPYAPKTLKGHDNYALSTEHTRPLGGAAETNTYVEGRRAPPTQEEYLTLENRAPTKPSVYEALDRGPDVYEDIIYDKPVEAYEDYIDMTQGMTKPDYENLKRSVQKDESYEHYLQPTR